MNTNTMQSDELLALAYHDMKSENYENALKKAKEILAKHDAPNEVYSFLGRLYATLGLFLRARESFELYLKLDPDSYLEMFQLGMVEKDLGNFEAAVDIWRKVLQVYPDKEETKYYLGELFIKLERIEEARKILLNLLETAEDESEFIPLADKLLNRIKGHH